MPSSRSTVSNPIDHNLQGKITTELFKMATRKQYAYGTLKKPKSLYKLILNKNFIRKTNRQMMEEIRKSLICRKREADSSYPIPSSPAKKTCVQTKTKQPIKTSRPEKASTKAQKIAKSKEETNQVRKSEKSEENDEAVRRSSRPQAATPRRYIDNL